MLPMENNNKLDRKIVLDALIRHETLALPDLAKKENLGVVPDITHLKYLLEELDGNGQLQILPGTDPVTYTITQKGIEEGLRLRNMDKQAAEKISGEGVESNGGDKQPR